MIRSGCQALVATMLVAALWAACKSGPDHQEPATLETGDTVRVVDLVKGDELVVEKDGDRAELRLLGLHAFAAIMHDPALKAHSDAAKAFVKQMLVGKDVQITLGKTAKDIHGRYLAYVSIGGVDQNINLIKEGHAVVYTEFAFEREQAYLEAEATTRVASKGLWGTPAAVQLIHGLRGLWAETRKHGGEASLQDDLAQQTESAAGAPADGTAKAE